MSKLTLRQFLLLILVLSQSLLASYTPYNKFNQNFVTILIYGDGNKEDLERNLNFTNNQYFPYFEVIAAVKSKELIDKVNPQFKVQNNIKFIQTEYFNDFAKILQNYLHLVNGEYISLVHAKTISKNERIREQIIETKTYKCNVMVSEINILNHKGEILENAYLIDQDYQRDLDVILFSMDFRLEASIFMRKVFFTNILNQTNENIDRYFFTNQIVKLEEVNFSMESFVQITLENYHHIFMDESVIQAEEDTIKFKHYDNYLNSKNISLTAPQFFSLLNCSYDFLACDESNLEVVRYLMIDLYMTFEKLFKYQMLELYSQIEFIHNHLWKQGQARKYPREYPLASVVMSSHNRDYFLIKSISYVLEQSYVNWELVISDNNSSNPNTHKILQLLDGHPRIRVFYLYTDQNEAFSFNYAISYAEGEYIAIQDDDDIMMPFRLEYQIDFLKRNPIYEICGSAYKPISEIGRPKYFAQNYVNNFAEAKAFFLILNHVSHSTVTVRMTDRMKKYFSYSQQAAYDYSLWIKLLFELENENIRFFVLPKHVTGIRVHSNKISNQKSETSSYKKQITLKQIEILERIYPEIFEDINFQCFLKIFLQLKFQYDTIQTCEDLDFEQFSKEFNDRLRHLPFWTQQDIKDLDLFYKYFNDQYIEKLNQKKLIIMQQKLTFDCVLHQGDIKSLILHIEQLKDSVDYFIILYSLSPGDNISNSYLYSNKVLLENQSKLMFHFLNSSIIQDQQKLQYKLNEIFDDLINEKILFSNDYIMFSNSSEIINPSQLRRFQQLGLDMGIFALRQLSTLYQQNGQSYKLISILIYELLEKLGIQYLDDYSIQLDFEDKLDIIEISKNRYASIYHLKDAGLYIDDCRNYKNELALQGKIRLNLELLSNADKRYFDYFHNQIKVTLKAYCDERNKGLFANQKSEL
ncbi:UNKNOWN [Stylonychia lemnae]|uniref:Glycosyltransferase 2-like domain-containing protein n=1 Tax=Stylonychia lemnae TaxID=5949 RepID=A0A078AK60_STYLE|nr:UNKNOWN [Stylonychia lemnae]|eukprot:CDW81188.1 UNKNOWN [Stylonychia lemnae]